MTFLGHTITTTYTTWVYITAKFRQQGIGIFYVVATILCIFQIKNVYLHLILKIDNVFNSFDLVFEWFKYFNLDFISILKFVDLMELK